MDTIRKYQQSSSITISVSEHERSYEAAVDLSSNMIQKVGQSQLEDYCVQLSRLDAMVHFIKCVDEHLLLSAELARDEQAAQFQKQIKYLECLKRILASLCDLGHFGY